MADNMPGTGVSVDVKLDLTQSFNNITADSSKGLSRLCNLVFGRRETEIVRHRMLTAAQTEADCQLIISGQARLHEGKILPIEQQLDHAPTGLFELEAKQELENLAGNLKQAIYAIKDKPDETISDTDVDQDFFSRWRREAKVIGKEELQSIWGRLLAEEISRPGSISFRTMETIKNISANEASTFCKIAPFIEGGNFLICNFSTGTLPQSIKLQHILSLHEAGLFHYPAPNVAASPGSSAVSYGGKLYTQCDYHDYAFLIYGPSQIGTIPGVPLTEAGIQIYSICDCDTLSMDDIVDQCKVISASSNFSVREILVCKLKGGSPDLANVLYSYSIDKQV